MDFFDTSVQQTVSSKLSAPPYVSDNRSVLRSLLHVSTKRDHRQGVRFCFWDGISEVYTQMFVI